MYSAYDPPSSRSPGSHRHQPQTLHRQPSRQFDAYGQLPPGALYQPDDHHQQQQPYQQPQPRSYDRLNATVHSPYDYNMGAQGWNANPFGQNSIGALGGAATTRSKQQGRGGGRSALPAGWLDQPQGLPTFALGGLGNGHPNSLLNPAMQQTQFSHDVDEELIPTAIVIKNIPFAVKKEQLVSLMTELRLPLPYAFNYHFDNGVFRGLAFANFTTAEETAQVIEAMNHFELHGRKLRVEYKKMLPLAERERIEREKRERRGQLEEQHRPMGGGSLQTQQSYSSLASHIPATSPSPVSGLRQQKPAMWRGDLGAGPSPTNPTAEVDLNDPQVLQFYSQLLLFKESPERDSMTFPSTLSPPQRRIVHTLAHQLGLAHISKGDSGQRQLHIFKVHDSQGLSPPMPQMPVNQEQPGRRGLNRAATTDFSDVRASEGFYNAFGRQASGLLGFPDSPGGLAAAPNLRAAKSYADLRSYTPSPAPSTASHPIGRLGGQTLEGLSFTGSSTNPNGTPTTASMSQRDDGLLERELGRMQIGGGFAQGGSPRSLRQMTSWDNPGPIGGHRTFGGGNYDDRPSRQPRGPVPERGSGFSRPRQNGHQGRGSDELSPQSNVEILVGQ